MKRKIFEVVKLKSGEMATIISIDKNRYKIEVIGKNGKKKKITDIYEDDIEEVIVAK